jgi:hypothetical protein
MPIDIIGKFSEKPQFHQFFHTFGEGRVGVMLSRGFLQRLGGLSGKTIS